MLFSYTQSYIYIGLYIKTHKHQMHIQKLNHIHQQLLKHTFITYRYEHTHSCTDTHVETYKHINTHIYTHTKHTNLQSNRHILLSNTHKFTDPHNTQTDIQTHTNTIPRKHTQTNT